MSTASFGKLSDFTILVRFWESSNMYYYTCLKRNGQKIWPNIKKIKAAFFNETQKTRVQRADFFGPLKRVDFCILWPYTS